ncbi:hypothetical protein KY320_02735 [Candidatus Woesearchaeota archaeon]|nr:hypothetical protein [Candidatus Woesearchaeota archaeon]
MPKKNSKKKQLTRQEEFEILKLVLDKYLWLGTGVMIFGLYKIIVSTDFFQGFAWIVVGSVLLLLFLYLIVKEYEFIK